MPGSASPQVSVHLFFFFSYDWDVTLPLLKVNKPHWERSGGILHYGISWCVSLVEPLQWDTCCLSFVWSNQHVACASVLLACSFWAIAAHGRVFLQFFCVTWPWNSSLDHQCNDAIHNHEDKLRFWYCVFLEHWDLQLLLLVCSFLLMEEQFTRADDCKYHALRMNSMLPSVFRVRTLGLLAASKAIYADFCYKNHYWYFLIFP